MKITKKYIILPHSLLVSLTLEHQQRQENNKKQDAYGMECNGTTIMYFLQSLGVFPPEMTRKEFEYAFVPNAYPYAKINDKNTPITVGGLPIDTYNTKDTPLPIPNGTLLFPQNVFSEALLGQLKLETNSGISLVGQSLSLAITKMTNITSNFAVKLPQQRKYGFVTEYHKSIVQNSIKGKLGFVVDLSQKLTTSDFDTSYFATGKSIFVSVDYGYFDGSTSHYALIQGASVANFMYKDKKYYIYPADDSLAGLAFVIAPTFIGTAQDIALEGIGNDGSYTYGSTKGKLHSVAKASLQLGLQ